MATSEAAVLDAVKTQLLALLPATPAAAIDRVYTYPDEHNKVSARVPFAIVGRQQTETNSFRNGVVWSDWIVEVIIFLHKGELLFPSKDFAEAALIGRQWRLVVQDWYFGSNPFNLSTVQTAGNLLEDFTALQWNQEPYSGVFFQIPVRQQVIVP